MHSKRKKKTFGFIVVGTGLTGVSFTHLPEQHDKGFCLLSDRSQVTSLVAGGVYNPVVLKRLTPIWKTKEIMACADRFYDNIEATMGQPLRTSLPVLRKFTSVEEQNNWFAASDTSILQHYLGTTLRITPSEMLSTPYLLDEVLHAGRLDIERYIQLSLCSWQGAGIYYFHSFGYSTLGMQPDLVAYQEATTQHIVSCEGCGISKNPCFNSLPMRPCKGGSLTIRAPDLQLQAIFRNDGSIISMRADIYRIGATYDPEDLTGTITEVGRAELLEKLYKATNSPYEIISHQAAIRPTVDDRRPLVGAHPLYSHLWVLSGLGTRGMFNVPLYAQVLHKAVFERGGIPPEVNVNCFNKWLHRKG